MLFTETVSRAVYLYVLYQPTGTAVLTGNTPVNEAWGLRLVILASQKPKLEGLQFQDMLGLQNEFQDELGQFNQTFWKKPGDKFLW